MITDKSKPSFGQRIITFIRFILRLLFVLVLAVGLGVGIYFGAVYGIPELYRRYVQPVEDNTLRLDDMEARQTQDVQQIDEYIETLQDRLTILEIQSDTDKDNIADLESQLATAISIQATQSLALATLEPFPSAFSDSQADIEAIQTALDDFSNTVEENSQQVESLSADDQWRSNVIINMQHDLQIIRTMEFLTRARLYLSQGNLEQGEANIQAGLDIIIALMVDVPTYQKETLFQISNYLNDAIESLPENPVRTADQMEGAWQFLIQGLPASEPSTTVTPTLTATPTPTPNE
ncbi:MAG: hypothetical protein U9Q82_13355 [Chloroflexota bacterium]|nr:hypothetical protein [Chloroflexota bacterium]